MSSSKFASNHSSASMQSVQNRLKRLGFLTAFLFAAFSITNVVDGQEKSKPSIEEQQATRPLNEHLKAFTPYTGTWEIDTKWASGDGLWARNEYSIGMNGNFFQALTWTKNESGKVYQRYQTIWRWNDEKKVIEAYGFTYDGSITITESELDTTNAEQPIIRSQWRPNEESPFIKQEVQISKDGNSYDWRVWSSPDKKEWTKLMDGVYKRVNNKDKK